MYRVKFLKDSIKSQKKNQYENWIASGHTLSMTLFLPSLRMLVKQFRLLILKFAN